MLPRIRSLLAVVIIAAGLGLSPLPATAAPTATPDLFVQTSVNFGMCRYPPTPGYPWICGARGHTDDPISFSASVTNLQFTPTDPPTGTVTFFLDGAPVGTATLTDHVARVGPFFLTKGEHTVRADYSGDANYLPVSNTSIPTVQISERVRGQPDLVVTRAPETSGDALVNLTVAEGRSARRAAGGFVTGTSCSEMMRGTTTSNVNFLTGEDIANLAIVGRENDNICISSSVLTDVVVDVQGYFTSGYRDGLGFDLVAPRRVLDTRATPRPDSTSIVRVNTGAPPGAEAVLVNLTMTQAAANGFITADKCSRTVLGDVGRSNGNYRAGRDIANLSVVPVDPDGSFCITTSAPVHLLADVQAVLTRTATVGGGAVIAERLVDTRSGTRLAPGGVLRVPTHLPAGTPAAAINITMTDGTAPGFVTADRCSRLGPGDLGRSNGNYPIAQNVANLNIVALDDDGAFCITASAPVHLVVDLQGVFNTGGANFTLVPPTRVYDGRRYG